MRFVAENVDKRLRELRATTPLKAVWRSGERLLVAVGPSPFSTQLVRWTRRMAAAQGAPWVAVSVESSRQLTPEARRRLDQNLSLARELGAEVVVTHDEDVAEALVRVAVQHNATQIVVGKSRPPGCLILFAAAALSIDSCGSAARSTSTLSRPSVPPAKRVSGSNGNRRSLRP